MAVERMVGAYLERDIKSDGGRGRPRGVYVCVTYVKRGQNYISLRRSTAPKGCEKEFMRADEL